MFQFTTFPLPQLWIGCGMTEVRSAGFPHSDTHGSRIVCISPWLFAAFCVLHRLLVPRHSPIALIRLTYFRLPSYDVVNRIWNTLVHARFYSHGQFKTFILNNMNRHVCLVLTPLESKHEWIAINRITLRIAVYTWWNLRNGVLRDTVFLLFIQFSRCRRYVNMYLYEYCYISFLRG